MENKWRVAAALLALPLFLLSAFPAVGADEYKTDRTDSFDLPIDYYTVSVDGNVSWGTVTGNDRSFNAMITSDGMHNIRCSWRYYINSSPDGMYLQDVTVRETITIRLLQDTWANISGPVAGSCNLMKSNKDSDITLTIPFNTVRINQVYHAEDPPLIISRTGEYHTTPNTLSIPTITTVWDSVNSQNFIFDCYFDGYGPIIIEPHLTLELHWSRWSNLALDIQETIKALAGITEIEQNILDTVDDIKGDAQAMIDSLGAIEDKIDSLGIDNILSMLQTIQSALEPSSTSPPGADSAAMSEAENVASKWSEMNSGAEAGMSDIMGSVTIPNTIIPTPPMTLSPSLQSAAAALGLPTGNPDAGAVVQQVAAAVEAPGQLVKGLFGIYKIGPTITAVAIIGLLLAIIKVGID